VNGTFANFTAQNFGIAVEAPVAPQFALDGGAGDDSITGTAGADVINGQGGADSLNGQAGDDTITGGAQNDVITGGEGNDTFNFNVTNDGIDSVNGGNGRDVVNVTADAPTNVRISFLSTDVGNGNGNNVADVLGAVGTPYAGTTFAANTLAVLVEGEVAGAVTASGANASRYDDEGTVFVGGAGVTFDVRDLASGAARGEAFTSVELGTNAADTVTITTVNGYVNAGQGNDTINGGTGADFLVGGAGDDSLVGGAGADSFIGGGGNDIINTGADSDTIIFTAFTTAANGTDVIQSAGFTAGAAGDVLNFRAATFAAAVTETIQAAANNAALTNANLANNGIIVLATDAVGDAAALKTVVDATDLDTNNIGNRVIVWEINATTVGVGILNNADATDNNNVTIETLATLTGFADQAAVNAFTGALVAANFDII